MELKNFLNPIKEEVVYFVASERFVDGDGKPIEWELKPISSRVDEEIRKECTTKVQIKKNRRVNELDAERYMCRMVVESVVAPNLHAKELLDGYGVMSATELIKVMLKPGEYATLTEKVSEINGFDVSMEELVDQAKN
ncbi:MAG: phage tail assembly chaperone [Anaerotignaceae bacterium]